MRELFIPETKNPPAKVKDPGLISLVMEGAGVFNAKSGEIILLPIGVSTLSSIAQDLTEALLEKNGIQNIDCSASDESASSLAERYVREYGEKALAWMAVSGRKLNLWGWAETEEDVKMKTAFAADTIRSIFERYIPDFNYILEVRSGTINSMAGVCPTAKGSLYETEGLVCPECGNYFHGDSAYVHAVKPLNSDQAEKEVTDVHTPGAHTIPLLCEQLGLDPSETLKAMLYTVIMPNEKKTLLFAMIRGDKNISINKLHAYVDSKFKGASFRKAENDEIVSAFGEVAGFCGPVGVPSGVHMVADKSLKGGKNFVVGGNRPDYHRTGCCWGRDFEPEVADLLLFEESTPCPENGRTLASVPLRKICTLDCYSSDMRDEKVLSCRDRDGEHKWPYRWKAEISLEALILSFYEKKDERIKDEIFEEK
ncbi:MAG: YbaK/EbsC family protein [Synergistaceae bacterium]|nr:YbaK/EbsC family protein [Synergistaceae bacterium]